MQIIMYLLMGLAMLGGISLLVAGRLVRAVAGLLGTLVILAMIYFALGAEAAGAAQLLVYAGGMVVLLLFGVMTSGPAGQGLLVRWQGVATGLLVAGGIAYGLARMLAGGILPAVIPPLSAYTGGTMAGAGKSLIEGHLLAFEVLALLLLIVLVFATAFAHRADSPTVDN